MKLVVDSNVVIAGVLRDGFTRRLLMEAPIEFRSPESMLGEIKRHRSVIASRADLSETEFDLLLALLTERIEIVPMSEYTGPMKEAAARIGARDPGDVPFLALALASRSGVWTYNRKHFEETGVEVWTTASVAAWVKSAGGT